MRDSHAADPGSNEAPVLVQEGAGELAPGEALQTPISRNVRWNFLGSLGPLVVTLVTLPTIVGTLGPEAYGIIATVGIITNYLSFLDLGLAQGTTKFVAGFAGRGRWDQVRAVFWTSMGVYSLLALVATTLVLLIAPTAATRWFRVSDQYQAAAVNAFVIGGFAAGLVLLNFGPTALLRGLGRFDFVNKVAIAVGAAQPLLTLVLVVAGASIPVIVLGNVVLLLGAFVANVWLSGVALPMVLRPIWDTAILRQLAVFGGYLAAASVLVPIIINAEKLLLASFVSVGAVTYYMVPHSLISRLAIIPGSFSSALFPAFAAAQDRGDFARVDQLSNDVARATVYVFAPVVAGSAVFGPALLALWLGESFAAQSGTALQVLTFAAFVHSFAWSLHMLIQALGRTDLTFRIYLIQLVVYLPIAAFGVRTWGVNGAAAAWLVRVTVDTILVDWYVRRLTGISLLTLVREPRISAILLSLAAVFIGMLVSGPFGVVLLGVGAVIATGSAARPFVATLRSVAAGGFGTVPEPVSARSLSR